MGAPYETARARLLLGLAYKRSGDEHAGTAELEGALATFERLGARLDAEQVQGAASAAYRRTARSCSRTSSTPRGCSRPWATTSGSGCSRVTTTACASGITELGGEVVKKTGDGYFASFETPKTAVDAAVAIQRALADEIVAPDVRIGVHTGEAFRTGRGREPTTEARTSTSPPASARSPDRPRS